MASRRLTDLLVSSTAAMSNLLSQYLQENGLNHTQASAYPVFFNRTRGKLTREGVAYIVAKYMDVAKKVSPGVFPEKVSPFCFRQDE